MLIGSLAALLLSGGALPPLLPDTATGLSIVLAPAESLHVTLAGPATGRAVVIIPGMASPAYAFRKVIPPLAADGIRVVVVEPLGVGASSRPDGADYSMTAQAARIAAVMDTLGIGRAAIVAHAVSVSIALRMAVHHPEHVDRMLLIDGGPYESLATSGIKKALRFSLVLKLFAGRGRIRKEVRNGLIASSGDTTWITPEVVEAYSAGPAGDISAVLRTLKGMSRAVEPDSISNELHLITVPVRLLLGGAPHDGGVGDRRLTQMMQRIPDVQADSVAGAGLHIHEEQPQVVIRAVLALLALRPE
jgi:pimeloyl-ACP methyl ester carboxylesterase